MVVGWCDDAAERLTVGGDAADRIACGRLSGVGEWLLSLRQSREGGAADRISIW